MTPTTSNSIVAAISKAQEIAQAWASDVDEPFTDVWFRGVKSNCDLTPSNYWKKNDEWSSIATFNQLARNIATTTGFDDWDRYCLARHHGIPTRLLDWSEGILQAMFFAFDGWDGTTTPCVWILRPDVLNKKALNEDAIMLPGSELTNMWLPPLEKQEKENEGEAVSNELPIAIYPARSNPRIIGQLGVFTVHGTNTEPLNTILERDSGHQKFLARIDFQGLDPKQVRSELHYLGLRQSVIYPDADHIAKDVGLIYEWGD